MDLVCSIVLYNGEWINQVNEYKFNALATKGTIVHPSLTYLQLLEKVA